MTKHAIYDAIRGIQSLEGQPIQWPERLPQAAHPIDPLVMLVISLIMYCPEGNDEDGREWGHVELQLPGMLKQIAQQVDRLADMIRGLFPAEQAPEGERLHMLELDEGDDA